MCFVNMIANDYPDLKFLNLSLFYLHKLRKERMEKIKYLSNNLAVKLIRILLM